MPLLKLRFPNSFKTTLVTPMSSWSLFIGGQSRGFGEDCRGVDGSERSHVRLLSRLHRCKLKHHRPPANDSSKIQKIYVSSSSSNLKFVLGVCSLIFPCWRTCISTKQEKCDKNMKCCKYISFLSYGCLLYRYFFIENVLRHAKCQMIYPYEDLKKAAMAFVAKTLPTSAKKFQSYICHIYAIFCISDIFWW